MSAFIVAEVTRLEEYRPQRPISIAGLGLRLEQCDLRQIAEEAVRMFEEVCRERSITIERAYAETPLIEGEKERILEAIENLISNAIDAMPGGGTLPIAIGKELSKR